MHCLLPKNRQSKIELSKVAMVIGREYKEHSSENGCILLDASHYSSSAAFSVLLYVEQRLGKGCPLQ